MDIAVIRMREVACSGLSCENTQLLLLAVVVVVASRNPDARALWSVLSINDKS